MSDFTLRIDDLPEDQEFNGNEHVLRALLWQHFQSILDHFKKQEEIKEIVKEAAFPGQSSKDTQSTYEIADV